MTTPLIVPTKHDDCLSLRMRIAFPSIHEGSCVATISTSPSLSKSRASHQIHRFETSVLEIVSVTKLPLPSPYNIVDIDPIPTASRCQSALKSPCAIPKNEAEAITLVAEKVGTPLTTH